MCGSYAVVSEGRRLAVRRPTQTAGSERVLKNKLINSTGDIREKEVEIGPGGNVKRGRWRGRGESKKGSGDCEREREERSIGPIDKLVVPFQNCHHLPQKEENHGNDHPDQGKQHSLSHNTRTRVSTARFIPWVCGEGWQMRGAGSSPGHFCTRGLIPSRPGKEDLTSLPLPPPSLPPSLPP